MLGEVSPRAPRRLDGDVLRVALHTVESAHYRPLRRVGSPAWPFASRSRCPPPEIGTIRETATFSRSRLAFEGARVRTAAICVAALVRQRERRREMDRRGCICVEAELAPTAAF
jgi:hypothetical protein